MCKSSGRVGDDDVATAGHRRVEGVVDDRRWIGARGMGHELAVRSIGPDAELIDGRGPEGVGRGEEDGTALRSVEVGQLADGRGLAGAVDADHEDHRRLARVAGSGPPALVARHQARGELGPNGRLGRRRVLAGTGALDDLRRQAAADVAGDQKLLDGLPIGVSRPAPENAANARHEAAPAACEAGRQVARSLRPRLVRRIGGLSLGPAGRGNGHVHRNGGLGRRHAVV